MKRMAVIGAAGALAVALIAAMLELPAAAIDLPAFVAAHLGASGTAHPVTAALLNFRGYDTLLEIGVLLAALIVVLAVSPRTAATVTAANTANTATATTTATTATAAAAPPSTEPVLQALARLAVPLMLLAAVYLLWAGGHRPGGAFQAGAVLGAAAVLLFLAGLLPRWEAPGRALRAGLAGGFIVFLGIAAGLLAQGALLSYPADAAGLTILAIEAGLTVSIGLILAGLFLFLS